MADFEFSSPRADSAELQRIKSNYQVADNERSELSELRKYNRKNPVVSPSGIISTDDSFGAGAISGLTYPLTLDGKGGLSTSSNYTRLSEQIKEVLETKIGERVYRQFFGLPELIFETISEDILASIIKKQLVEALPFEVDLNVEVGISEDGTSAIYVSYSLENAGPFIVKHSMSIDNA